MSDSPTHSRHRAALAVVLGATALTAAAAPAAHAAPVSVKLRVEGKSSTFYEKSVTTEGHDVTTQSGGTHKCDGTNGGANPSPGATSTATLDDGAKTGGYTFDATYSSGFEDFFVNRIGPDSNSSSEFWGHFQNFELSQVGGCQQRVTTGDEVLWTYDAFSKAFALDLDGPGAVRAGQAFSVRATNGATGAPLSGASVGGRPTGADGRATLSYSKPGIYRLKATRADSVRSPLLTVCVDPPDAPACTSGDKSAPEIELLSTAGAGGYASDRFRSRTVVVSWQGDDGQGSGVSTYDLDVRELGAAAASRAASPWRRLLRNSTRVSRRFRGLPGREYEFRVTAVDRAGNRRSDTGEELLVPVDDTDRSLIRFSRGWKRLERSGAWGRRVTRSTRRGASARLRFRGSRLALIGRRLPRGGRLRVTIDGRSRTVRLRGRPRHRRVLFTSTRLRSEHHRVRLVAVGGGPVELDAVAVQPR
ncbi:MAG: fibronectin type III domain-containing protein [Thermoleophilaceae bacterium]|nr:fibronectin type III domain-containing protein [Thermoleophilaceae bacterium]